MKLIKTKKIIDENVKIDFFTEFLASAAYTGFVPKASGTFGSGFAMIFLFISEFYNPVILFTLSFIFFFTGIIVSGRMMQRYGDDPSVVVIDEVVGQWLSLGIISIFFPMLSIQVAVISFLTFRFFDIFKIFPSVYFDKLKSGLGIMMDDVIAGIYSGTAGVIILYIMKHI
ncbi:MAG: phosphatidylglycerophosphatase A [Ignavibacteria bacterium]|nr:phosphatidylglycerophosphatase A [Ignavibacteria bacterium]